MAEVEYLYHYTAMKRWEQILDSGYLKLTPSNLLKPVNPRMVKLPDGSWNCTDETDAIKPVVWLTDSIEAAGHGNDKIKQEIQIVIPYDKEKHHWWVEWKDKNRMNKSWFKKLTSNGERYGTWYVCEEIIPVSAILYVKNLLTGEIIFDNREK